MSIPNSVIFNEFSKKGIEIAKTAIPIANNENKV